MAAPSLNRADELLNLARARFDNLSEAEEKVLRAAPLGEFAGCGPSQNDEDPANDPSKADQWGPEHTIRAELLRWICIDRSAKDQIDPRGVQVYGARIVGELNLSFAASVEIHHADLTGTNRRGLFDVLSTKRGGEVRE